MDQAHPEQIAAWARGHWDIENRLHWVRDMVTGEDRHQLRTRNGPLISAALRNPATRPHPPLPRTPHTHRRHHQNHDPTPPTSHQTTHPTTPLNQPCRPTGFDPPERIIVHLDASYDSRKTRELLEMPGCDARISPRGTPLQAGRCQVIEHTDSWHTRGFGRLQVHVEVRTRVIEAFIALANTIITIRNLIHHAWTTHRWDQRPTRKP